MYHCHHHPQHATNCYPRLAVDGDDLKWVVNEKKYCYYCNSFMKSFGLKTPGVILRKLSHPSQMQHGALVHRQVNAYFLLV